MANQSNIRRLSPRKSTASGATKIGNVWVTGTALDTSRLATTRKKITPPSPPNTPAAKPQPAAASGQIVQRRDRDEDDSNGDVPEADEERKGEVRPGVVVEKRLVKDADHPYYGGAEEGKRLSRTLLFRNGRTMRQDGLSPRIRKRLRLSVSCWPSVVASRRSIIDELRYERIMIKIGCNYLSYKSVGIEVEDFIRTCYELRLDCLDFHLRAFPLHRSLIPAGHQASMSRPRAAHRVPRRRGRVRRRRGHPARKGRRRQGRN